MQPAKVFATRFPGEHNLADLGPLIRHGDYRSSFKGRGEFADVREYLPGDDVRFLHPGVYFIRK